MAGVRCGGLTTHLTPSIVHSVYGVLRVFVLFQKSDLVGKCINVFYSLLVRYTPVHLSIMVRSACNVLCKFINTCIHDNDTVM